MKAKMVSIFLVLFTVINVLQAQEFRTLYNVDDSKIGLQGYSPVSYLELGNAQRGLQNYKSVFDGISYYFTSSDQKAKFDTNPGNYLPQYGGFCAFGVSVGAKFRVDPNKFVVSGGKLYLFLYDLEVDAQQLWLQGNHKELIEKADTNWQHLKLKS